MARFTIVIMGVCPICARTMRGLRLDEIFSRQEMGGTCSKCSRTLEPDEPRAFFNVPRALTPDPV